ncbi:hypothetical protein EDEG_00318 [Edhazardia aedis USNM 41457]|uniref:Ribosomal protein eL8/eL30/eS12/Gadd45 domain-containing protein n=1 Tax=Edhazardia aedis (strain USNM 41457) TaxID=1003232 RepID=J9DKQ4_EDHAE|nr:hypothetical protein EDEG_00318 [Edhazardia aedis USNM 41457]|eukprot:EJW01972.1 hypothetical protein EDEG_00318 [Edhazardia aedis USNM 41457]
MAKSKKVVTGLADQLPLALKSGKYCCGYNQTIKTLLNKEAQVIVMTDNYPSSKRKLIEYYAFLAGNIPILDFEGSNNDLAKCVESFHRIGVISVIDQGEAELVN